MQPIPLEFIEGHYAYTQLTRQGMLAVYQQAHATSRICRYEVVRLRVAAAHTWPNGTTSPEREVYPGASRWGIDGWTHHTRTAAEAHLARLVAAEEAKHDAQ